MWIDWEIILKYRNDYDGELVAYEGKHSAVFLDGSWVGCDWFLNGTRQEMEVCREDPSEAIDDAKHYYT